MKSLLKLFVMVVFAVLVYNYFFGTVEEKQQSKEIFNEVKDLGKSAWNLLKAEKEKFDEGKYDDATEKIGNLLASLKEKAEALKDSELLDDIARLERKRQDLEREIETNRVEEYDGDGLRDSEAERIKDEGKDLLQDIEDLMKRMEEK